MSSVRLEQVVVVAGSPHRTRRGVRRRGPSRATPPRILDGIDLDIADGDLIVVIGSSGSGKTTLLRAIAGLEAIAQGRVILGDVDVTLTSPADRDVSMMFQLGTLMANRTVQRNVSFPLEIRQQPVEEIRVRVLAETRALHIEQLLHRSPAQLSAGEQQLVQMARALIRVPSVLLLDEPLSRLDAHVRHRMRTELRVLQQGYGVTTVLTTNDPVEALAIADRLVILDAGHVIQQGAPLEVYHQPVNLLAAQLTGLLEIDRVCIRAVDQGFWIDGDGVSQRAWGPSLATYVDATLLRGRRTDGESLFFDPDTGLRVS